MAENDDLFPGNNVSVSLEPIIRLATVLAVLGLAALPIAFRMRPKRLSRIGILITVTPSVLMLLLFYSLALHMHQVLGKWPESIGENSFPPALVAACSFTSDYFSVWMLIGIFVWPTVFLLCLAVRRWRGIVFYLAVYIFSALVVFGSLLLAPAKFLNWWWD